MLSHSEPRAHHRPAHQQGQAGQLGRRPVLVGEDLRQLQPDQDEQHRVHQEDEDLPERIAAKPRGGGGHVGRPVPHDHADGHRGENSGHAHLLGREVPDVATGERDHDAHHVVARDPLQHLDHHEPHDDAEGDAAGRVDHEVARRVEKVEAGSAHGGHGGAVGHQRRAVVHEALSLDHPREPARNAQPARDRGRRQRIGGRNDGAEREGRGPRQPGNRRVHDHGHGAHRHEHEPDGVQRDRAHVRTQVANRGEVRRVEQQRRQEDEQHDVRVELDLGHPGAEPHEASAHHEQDRVRHVQQPRESGERGHSHQQEQEDELDVVHRGPGKLSAGRYPSVRTRTPDGGPSSSSKCSRRNPFTSTCPGSTSFFSLKNSTAFSPYIFASVSGRAHTFFTR